jgi:hypothetical protein
MGNVLSDDSEPEFLEEGFNLDSPDADKEINYGTAAPIWQNKKEIEPEEDLSLERTEGGKEVLLLKEKHSSIENGSTDDRNSRTAMEKQSRQDSSTLSESGNSTGSESRKQQRQNSQTSNNSTDSQNMKKMSYIQMAKLGYQELVNAIIRPPRCDYRVSRIIHKAVSPSTEVFLNSRIAFVYLT